MVRFTAWRLLQSLLVLAVMSFVIYALIGLMPGDPVDQMIAADPKLTSADVAELRARYGLDQPISERYLRWLGDTLQGNFGFSRLHAAPVLSVLSPALMNTLMLMGLAFVLSILIAVPAGIAAAAKPYSRLDYVINLLAFAGISVPSFWLALLLIMVFSVMLGVLPAGRDGHHR
jgi:peptide/nickel transport system permease protein